MKKNLLLIFTILFISFESVFCQSEFFKPLPSKQENKDWIDKLEVIESHSEKILLIKSKIISDSIYSMYSKDTISIEYVENDSIIIYSCDTFKIKDNWNRHFPPLNVFNDSCGCKLLFLLELRNKGYLFDKALNPKFYSFIELLNEDNISKIEVLTGNEALEYLGIRAKCGVIILESANKKLKRNIDKILKQ